MRALIARDADDGAGIRSDRNPRLFERVLHVVFAETEVDSDRRRIAPFEQPQRRVGGSRFHRRGDFAEPLALELLERRAGNLAQENL